MKKLMRCLCILGLGCAAMMSASLQASTPKKKPTVASSSQANKVHSKAPQAAKSRVKAGKAGTASKSKKAKPSSSQSCTVIKRPHGKSRRSCKSVPAEPLLQSPIQDNALNKSASSDKTPEIKARTAPDRAYAVDGETFFFQGRKYHVAGTEDSGNSDMAKQRLQKALESGTLSIDPISTDDTGVSNANVRINGRDLAELLR
ncbi:MAG: hypothetical protein H6R19_2826 [Proteobacteria bacterium]|nr:hypothetical protein [Pseudomonadota bacterium]